MFRDDRQKANCNRALLAPLDLAALWTAAGPTERACELLTAGGGKLSRGQALMVRVTFDVWNGEAGATLGELLRVLDCNRLRDVGTLLAAVAEGCAAVDAWLAARDGNAR